MHMYLKAVDSLGHVYGSDVHELSVLGILVVSQEGQHWQQTIGMGQHLQLIAAQWTALSYNVQCIIYTYTIITTQLCWGLF